MADLLLIKDIIYKAMETMKFTGVCGNTLIFLWTSPPESSPDISSDSLAGSEVDSRVVSGVDLKARLYGVNASPGGFNLAYSSRSIVYEARKEFVTAAAVMAPDVDAAETVQRELNQQLAGMNIRVRTYLYDYIGDDEGQDREWEFEVDVANLGEVVTHRIT